MLGVTVRLYERGDRGGAIYRKVRLGGGAKDRASLGTTDRTHALARHFADADPVTDLSQHRVDAYAAVGRDRLPAAPHRRRGRRAGTVRNELQVLVTMLRWARIEKAHGRPLLSGNPLDGVKLPKEANTRRPVTTHARYPAADVMAGGGWKSRAVMEASYQHADPATTYAVIALAPNVGPHAAGDDGRATTGAEGAR